MMRDLLDRLVHYLATRMIWGPRCSDFEPRCVCCEHWREHDWLFDSRKDIRR